jgi:hypothetical protein
MLKGPGENTCTCRLISTIRLGITSITKQGISIRRPSCQSIVLHADGGLWTEMSCVVIEVVSLIFYAKLTTKQYIICCVTHKTTSYLDSW